MISLWGTCSFRVGTSCDVLHLVRNHLRQQWRTWQRALCVLCLTIHTAQSVDHVYDTRAIMAEIYIMQILVEKEFPNDYR